MSGRRHPAEARWRPRRRRGIARGLAVAWQVSGAPGVPRREGHGLGLPHKELQASPGCRASHAMIAALVVASLAGSVELARFYGFVVALAALGLSWGTFAWFPQVLGTAAPIGFGVIAVLLVVGLLRDRRSSTP